MMFFDPVGMSLVKNINNELEILKSRPLAEAVAKKLLDLKFADEEHTIPLEIIYDYNEDARVPVLASVERVTDRILKSVQFSPIKDSDLIKITAKSTLPEEAALIANTYAHAYYEKNLRTSRTRTRAAREFLEEQVKLKQKALAEAEQRLQQFMEQKGIVMLDEEATKMIDQLSQLEALLDATRIEKQSLAKSLQSYQKQLAKIEPTVAKSIGEANDPYIKLLQEELAKLEVQRDVVIARNPNLTDKELYDETLQEIDTQINSLRKKLEARTREYLQSLGAGTSQDPGYSLVQIKQNILEKQIELQALEAKEKAIQEVTRQYRNQFEKLPQKSIAYARLQRARLSAEKLYLLVQEKYNEAAIAEQSQFGYIEIVNPAIVPNEPVSPKTKSNLILGALIGLGLGVGLVFLLEYLNNTIKTPEDLRKTGFTPLTIIPIMENEIKRAKNKRKPLLNNDKNLDYHLVSYLDPRSVVSESYRRLRTNIQFARLDKPIKSLVVSSPGPSEGKTTTVANLAITLAQMDKKVLLIDTDMRRPSLHRLLKFKKEPGLTNFLFGKAKLEDTIQKTWMDNLDFIPSGKIPPNPSEILSSAQMVEFLKEAQEVYDLVIFDSPPILAVTDAAILSTFVDGLILVVSAGSTRLDAFRESIEVIESVKGKILGVVLNNFDHQKAYGGYYGYYRSRYYSYYYHYHYHYSSEEQEQDTTT